MVFRKVLAIILSCLFLGCASSSANKNDIFSLDFKSTTNISDYYFEVKWQLLSSSLIEHSIEDKTPIFIFFYDNKCFECVDMLLRSFSYPEVVTKLNKDFIPVILDVSDPYYEEVVNLLLDQNTKLPAIGVMFSDKTLIHSGYITGEKLHEVLNEFAPEENTQRLKSYGTTIVKN